MPLEPEVAADVATAVLQWFETSSVCQKKHPPVEWTVLAGIVLRMSPFVSSASDDGAVGTFRVLAAATGNKCLGRRDLNTDGLVVNDCHAEILARRAFLRYLYAEALAWHRAKASEAEPTTQSIFERHPMTQRLVLRPQHSLHLYVSEAPCGDAAIYELRDEVVDELVQRRVERVSGPNSAGPKAGSEIEHSALRLTGAKAHTGKRSRRSESAGEQEEPPEKRFEQTLGLARVKSGRSDLPVEKQTLSMSCSDKLAKWNALGLQGSLLLQWFEPIFLRSIVVGTDEKAMSAVKQEQALRRAVCTRLQDRHALESTADSLTCETFVVSNIATFNRQRKSSAPPSSLALNWTRNEPHWTASLADPDRQLGPASSPPLSETIRFVSKFFSGSEIEVLMAATGLKQGAKKASKMDRHAMGRVASRLAKRNLLRAFHHVLAAGLDQQSLLTTVQELDYLRLKQSVPLGPSSSSPTLSAAVTPNNRRNQFFAAFHDWIGAPITFKQFKL
ncbi:hypothetical protein BBJ28_00006469 [Nothophytophthora sp. Chile5]|nr:hypothetical protein BBJ28_00006469 [Nothophytophthora sp. Chile5]